MAVSLLRRGRIKKIVLVRPAVEAGEHLGFLPGDLEAKINPYLRPLLDALHDLMDYDQIRRYMDNDLIEIAPLAYMRGRTLNDAVIILDEGQNATVPQMKMFLTRMGQNARIVVTGDITQVDLRSGPGAGWPTRSIGCGTFPGWRWRFSTGRTSSAIRWCRRSWMRTKQASRPGSARGGPTLPWPSSRPLENDSMSNGRRRPKLLRAQLRPADSGVIKEGRVAKQRTRAVQIALVVVSMLVCAAFVHGPGPPFTYRIGQRPDRQLRVNVKEFRIRNQTKTSNERQAAADQVPPSLINDPGPIQELAEKLDDLTTVVAKSARLEGLHENVRSVWKLTPESYLDLKAATDTPERRDNLHAQIAGGVRAVASRWRSGARHVAAERRIEPAVVDSQGGRAGRGGAAGAARSRGPRTDRQARGPGLSRILLGLHVPADRPDSLRPDRQSTG